MKHVRKALAILLLITVVAALIAMPALAADEGEALEAAEEASSGMDLRSIKALAAAGLIAIAAGVGAVGMAWSIAKSAESMARQPEAAGNIRSSLMLGLVFLETAIIYALIVAILIVFVL